jgi:hypothetical protein
MGWSRLRLRRYAVIAMSLLLACGALLGAAGHVAAVPSGDEAARQWLETVSTNISQPGRVFRAEVTIRERAENVPEVTGRATVWIDAEQRKGRFELRRENNVIMVSVVEGWEVTTYDAVNNKIATSTVPEDIRGNVRNPAFSVLAPSLIAAYQAGQINPQESVNTTLNDQFDGREAVKLAHNLDIRQEIQVPVAPPSGQGSGSGGSGGQQQQQPQTRTETITLQDQYNLYVDPTTGFPIMESVRRGDASDKELTFRTATFENPTLLDRSAVPAESLTLAAVRGMLRSNEQQLDRARGLGLALFWLGNELPRPFTDARSNRQSALTLLDVLVLDQPNTPRGVRMLYGARDEPTVPYVIITQQSRADWENAKRQLPTLRWLGAEGVERRPVQVPGAQGTLHMLQIQLPQTSGGQRPPQLPPLVLVEISVGDSITVIETPPLFVTEGRQGNPFLDVQQIAALAGALNRLNP